MKNILLSFLFLLLLVSCSKQSTNDFAASTKATESSSVVDYNVAEKDVWVYVDKIKGVNIKDPLLYSSVSIKPYYYEDVIVFYIVNYKDGWDILSADKRVPPIVASSTKGSISQKEIDTDPFSAFFAERAEKIAKKKKYDKNGYLTQKEIEPTIWHYLIDKPLFTETKVVIDPSDWVLQGVNWQITDSLVQDHLMSTTWHQNYPYNQYTPLKQQNSSTHCVTGCTMTAAGQVLNYLRGSIGKPSKMYVYCSTTAYIGDANTYMRPDTNGYYTTLTNETISFGNYAYSAWNNIASGNGNAISVLMAYLGKNFEAKYQIDTLNHLSTGASLQKIPNAFGTNFNIWCIYQKPADMMAIAYRIVNDQSPSIFAAYNSDTETGHAWVIDGARIDIKLYTYRYFSPSTLQEKYVYSEVAEYKYKMNLGWGPYYASLYGPVWYSFDDDWVFGGVEYNTDFEAVVGFN